MEIIKIGRSSDKNARVHFSNGISAKVPLELAVIGSEIPEEDFIVTEKQGIITYVYKTFYKEKRKFQVLPTIRDMSNFDSANELSLIKSRIRRHQDVFGRTLDQEEVNDLADDIFLHFWERGYFQGYNASGLKYESYISRGVRNYCIDYMKSSRYRFQRRCLSLNVPVTTSKQSTAEQIDFLEDKLAYDMLDKNLQSHMLNERLKEIAAAADEIGTGLVGVTYTEILNYMLFGEDFTKLADKTGYSKATLMSRRKKLSDIIYHELYSDFAIA